MENEYDCDTDCETDDEEISVIMKPSISEHKQCGELMQCKEVVVSDILDLENSLNTKKDIGIIKDIVPFSEKKENKFMGNSYITESAIAKHINDTIDVIVERIKTYIDSPLGIYIANDTGVKVPQFDHNNMAFFVNVYRNKVTTLYEKILSETDLSKHPYIEKYGLTVNMLEDLLHASKMDFYSKIKNDNIFSFVIKNNVLAIMKKEIEKDAIECYHLLINYSKNKQKSDTKIFEYNITDIWEHMPLDKMKKEFIYYIIKKRKRCKKYLSDLLIRNSIMVTKDDNKFYITLNIDNMPDNEGKSYDKVMSEHFAALENDLTVAITSYIKDPILGYRYASKTPCPLVIKNYTLHDPVLIEIYFPLFKKLYEKIKDDLKYYIMSHPYLTDKGICYEDLLTMLDISNVNFYVKINYANAPHFDIFNKPYGKLRSTMSRAIKPHCVIFENYVKYNTRNVSKSIVLSYDHVWEGMSIDLVLGEYLSMIRKKSNIVIDRLTTGFIKKHITIRKNRYGFVIELQLNDR